MNKQETILYIRGDMSAQKIVAGGSIAHTLGVIEGLINCGHKVVCATACMVKEIGELPVDEVKNLTTPRPFLSLPWRIAFMLIQVYHLLLILPLFKRHKISYIYQRCTIFNFLGVLLSRIKKVPLILEFNGSEVWIDKNWGASRKWGKLIWLSSWIERLNLKKAVLITVVSQPIKDDLIAQGISSEKILVNPNGVNIQDFDPIRLESYRNETRRRLNCEDKFVFGFVGTFSIWHGVNIMAKMVPEVLKKNPKAHFLFIGDGPLLNFLKQELENSHILKDQVTFTGMVPQKEAKKYLAACDAYLSPTQPNDDGTRFFGSPTKLFEYMSMAKPIIASDLEQLSEIVQPAVKLSNISDNDGFEKAIGILVEPKDVDGFIKAADYISNADQAALNHLGSNARKRAIENHTWDAHVALILDFAQRTSGNKNETI